MILRVAFVVLRSGVLLEARLPTGVSKRGLFRNILKIRALAFVFLYFGKLLNQFSFAVFWNPYLQIYKKRPSISIIRGHRCYFDLRPPIFMFYFIENACSCLHSKPLTWHNLCHKEIDDNVSASQPFISINYL